MSLTSLRTGGQRSHTDIDNVIDLSQERRVLVLKSPGQYSVKMPNCNLMVIWWRRLSLLYFLSKLNKYLTVDWSDKTQIDVYCNGEFCLLIPNLQNCMSWHDTCPVPGRGASGEMSHNGHDIHRGRRIFISNKNLTQIMQYWGAWDIRDIRQALLLVKYADFYSRRVHRSQD